MNLDELIASGAPDPGPHRTYSVYIKPAGYDEDYGWESTVKVSLLEQQETTEYKFFKKRIVKSWKCLNSSFQYLNNVKDPREVETIIVGMCKALVADTNAEEQHRSAILAAARKYST